MPQSVQEYLFSQGFSANQDEQRFERYDQKIPFADIAGHTVTSFKEKAFRKGWITPKESGVTETPAANPPSWFPLFGTSGRQDNFDISPAILGLPSLAEIAKGK